MNIPKSVRHLLTNHLLIHLQITHRLEEELKVWEDAYSQACALLENDNDSLNIKKAIENITLEVRTSTPYTAVHDDKLSIPSFTDEYSKTRIRHHYFIQGYRCGCKSNLRYDYLVLIHYIKRARSANVSEHLQLLYRETYHSLADVRITFVEFSLQTI